MEITEILLSAEAVHKCAKAHGVSVTAYLAAALVYAVYEEIPKSRLKKPVSLMVPANLRNFFPSASMTNFWSWIEIACDLGPEASFEDALQITGAAMQKEALKQEISTRMNDLVRIEAESGAARRAAGNQKSGADGGHDARRTKYYDRLFQYRPDSDAAGV